LSRACPIEVNLAVELWQRTGRLGAGLAKGDTRVNDTDDIVASLSPVVRALDSLSIEGNPRAAAITNLVLWSGYLQMAFPHSRRRRAARADHP